jgi:hypothetical protein
VQVAQRSKFFVTGRGSTLTISVGPYRPGCSLYQISLTMAPSLIVSASAKSTAPAYAVHLSVLTRGRPATAVTAGSCRAKRTPATGKPAVGPERSD